MSCGNASQGVKVVLVNPYVKAASTFPSGEFFECSAPNMGLAYLAAYVERAGFEVQIIDANALRMSSAQLEQALADAAPALVGVTATTTTLLDAFEAVRASKRACSGSLTSMGGIHVSRFPRETLQECAELDLVSIGEGEQTLLELLQALEAGSEDFSAIKGLAFRRGDDIVVTEERPYIEDLDSLPLPARHLLPLEAYQSGGQPHRTASIVSSRGCPFGCKFCAAPFIAGKRYRARSAQSLLEELDVIVNEYKMNTFEFVDDLFTLDKRRVFEFCEGVKQRGYELTWTCSARADTVTPELLRAMAGAGCRIIYYGVESGSQRILDKVGKRETLEQMAQAVKWTHEASMRSWGFFIIGFPDETPEEVEQTIAFASELELDYAEFFICSAFPGSPLYEYAIEESLVHKRSWSDISYGKANIENRYMTPQELERYMVKGYRDFYTSPRVMKRLRLYGQGSLVEEIERQTSDEVMYRLDLRAAVSRSLMGFEHDPQLLIPALQTVQEQVGYVPPEALDVIGDHLKVPQSQVFGVASFYNQFKLREPAKHSVQVCTGTACHVKGADLVLSEWEKQLGVSAGGKTEDGEFELETVACVGCCSAAPVVVADGHTCGHTCSAEARALADKIASGTLGLDDAPGAKPAGSFSVPSMSMDSGMGGSGISFEAFGQQESDCGGLGFDIV